MFWEEKCKAPCLNIAISYEESNIKSLQRQVKLKRKFQQNEI